MFYWLAMISNAITSNLTTVQQFHSTFDHPMIPNTVESVEEQDGAPYKRHTSDSRLVIRLRTDQ